MSTRTASWLAWSLWGLSLMLTGLALLLLALNLSHPHTHTFDSWLDSTLNAVFFSTVGAIVASRRSENLVGWLLCLYSLPAGEAMAWVSSWLLPIIIGFSVFFILLFPTGRLLSAP